MSSRRPIVVVLVFVLLSAPAAALGPPSMRDVQLQVNSYQPVGVDFLVSGEVQLLFGANGRRALPSQEYDVFVDGVWSAGGETPLSGRFEVWLRVDTPGLHRVEVVAPDNGLGEARGSRSFQAYGPPGAPQALAAEWAGGLKVNLSWSAPPASAVVPVSSYVVVRDGSTVATTGSLAHVDTVPRSGTYVYTVRAQNTAGEGPASAEATVAVTVPPPSAPENFTAVERAGSGIMDLAWSPPASTGGVALSTYRVERSVNGGDWTPLANLPPSTRAYADAAPVEAMTLDYRVSASNVADPALFGPAAAASLLPTGDVLTIRITSFYICDAYVRCTTIPEGSTYYHTATGSLEVHVGFDGTLHLGRIAAPSGTRVNTTHEAVFPGGCGRGCTNTAWAGAGLYTNAQGKYGDFVGPIGPENPESACRYATVTSVATYQAMTARGTGGFVLCS